MRYFIRKELDKPPVGIYEDIYEAAKNCEPGFKVYDENGKVMIGTLKVGEKEHARICKIDRNKAWSDLKEYYKGELKRIKNNNDPINKVTELFYEDFLNKMERFEEENPIIWEEH